MRIGGVALIVLAAIVLGSVTSGVAYWVGLNSANTGEMKTEVAAEVTPTDMPIVADEAETNTVVVFEAEGSIPPADKTMLQQRVVDPLVDYYMEANQGDLVSLTIGPNLQESKVNYPYTGSAVLSNGGNLGFLIAQTNGEINWWFPECMSQCPLSESYKSKYPEIAKMLGY